MISKILTFSLLTFFIISPVSADHDNNIKQLGNIFEELNISIDMVKDFIVRKDTLREGPENVFWTIVAQKDGSIIKLEVIKNIDAEYAKRHIEDKQFMISSLYERISSPYPGMISKVIECPDKFKPVMHFLEIGGKNTPVYFLYSTARLTYGACVDELLKHRGALAFFYSDERKTLYQIELFIPKEDFTKEAASNILQSFKLRPQIIKEENKPFLVKKEDKPFTAKEDQGYFNEDNLIMIAFEPLGARHVSAYGYPRVTTPHLDKFFKEAFFFKQAISPSSWTLPVFMSWFTSLYPTQHRVLNKYSTFTKKEKILSNLSELSPSVMTLAQILKKNGYTSAGFTGGAGVGSEFGFNLGFDVYFDTASFGGFDLTMPKALEWLKNHKDEKFFLFVQGFDVHGRYEFPGKFKNKFASPNYNGKYKGTSEEYWDLRNKNLDQGYLDEDQEDIAFWRNWYDGRIYEADKRFGNFLDELDKLGIMDKTVIIVSSGTGNEFFEHNRIDHGFSLYDEVLHVPLAIKIPGEQGRVIKDQVGTISIMPTLLDILNVQYGQTIKNQMRGASLVPLMRGENLKIDVFSETDYLFQGFERSLRTHNGWKFIYTMDSDGRELYNLRKDPNELNNLVDIEEEISAQIEQKLFNRLKSMGQNKSYHRKLLENVFKL